MNGYSKADIHIHTTFSDGLNEPEAIVNYVVTQTDLSVIAITDHNTIDGANVAYDYWRKHRAEFNCLEIIKGIEISTDVGHIIGLFLEEDIPARMSAEDTIKAIHEQGGLAIAAHPFTHLLPFTDFEGIGYRIGYLNLDGVEERSSIPTELYANWITAVFNQQHQKVARLGSSDAHYLTMVGKTYTWFPGKTALDFRRGIEARTVRAGGRINGPIAVWEVIQHLLRTRQLKKLLPNDRQHTHLGEGLKFHITELRSKPILLVKCVGEITNQNAADLKRIGKQLLSKNMVKVCLDLEEVTFVDSTGLGAILSLHKLCQKQGKQLILTHLQPTVAKTIQLVRLDRVLTITPTLTHLMGIGAHLGANNLKPLMTKVS
ncbi:MAG: anti-sigma factor antagonist [Chloroflexota bacterium]